MSDSLSEQQRLNDEKITVINRFASIVSHELKNPLSTLKNIAYYLDKVIVTNDEKTLFMIRTLGTEIDRTNRIISEMLDLSRVKKIVKKPSRLHELAEEAIASVPLNETIRLSKNLAPAEAMVDPDRFRQVIVNLLTNARDAMPEGGTLSVTLDQNAAAIELSVRDTGTGMDAETLSQAFDPLFTTKTKVLGLGLTVAREIVRMHNGTINLSSEQGKGTIARVIFPFPAV